jgi:hypothetical protein
MRPEFSTLRRIMVELAELVEQGAVVEDSPRLVADSPTTQWLPQASPITLWEPRGDHLQHLAQEALVC